MCYDDMGHCILCALLAAEQPTAAVTIIFCDLKSSDLSCKAEESARTLVLLDVDRRVERTVYCCIVTEHTTPQKGESLFGCFDLVFLGEMDDGMGWNASSLI